MLSMSKHQEDNLEGLLQSPLLKQLPRRGNINIANRQKANTTPAGSHKNPANAIHKYRHCKRRRNPKIRISLLARLLSKTILRLVMLSLSKHQEDNLEGLLQSPSLKQLPRRGNINIANRQKASTTPAGSHKNPANAIHKYRHCKRGRYLWKKIRSHNGTV